MAGVITRTGTVIETEILRSAAGLDDIKSMVLDSTKITDPDSDGRYVVQSGEVLGKISGSSKVMPIRMGTFGSGGSAAWVAADIVGIQASTVELWVGQGVTAGGVTDKETAVLHHGCDFNVSKLLGYTGNETITKAGLPTCLFR